MSELKIKHATNKALIKEQLARQESSRLEKLRKIGHGWSPGVIGVQFRPGEYTVDYMALESCTKSWSQAQDDVREIFNKFLVIIGGDYKFLNIYGKNSSISIFGSYSSMIEKLQNKINQLITILPKFWNNSNNKINMDSFNEIFGKFGFAITFLNDEFKIHLKENFSLENLNVLNRPSN